MLYYDRINFSEGIGVNKTSRSKECVFCHYWSFLEKGLKFQSYMCSWCHDLSIMSLNLSDIAILNIKGVDYWCIISKISKNEVINLIQILTGLKKPEHYKNLLKLNFRINFKVVNLLQILIWTKKWKIINKKKS